MSPPAPAPAPAPAPRRPHQRPQRQQSSSGSKEQVSTSSSSVRASLACAVKLLREQGFSVKWWKDKHNRHHAVPNVHGSGDGLNGDPDIDTMPLLAWSIKMAETGKVGYLRIPLVVVVGPLLS